MKVRADFVTNSSSSSFVISKKYLDEEQILAIKQHISLGKKLDMYNCDLENAWDIDENDEYIGFYTPQDNFDMLQFLDIIGVKSEYVRWGYDIWNSDIPEYKEKWRELLYEDQNRLRYKQQQFKFYSWI